jgi:RNA polymerase sigma-70 factor, ECF subfamily
MWMFFWVRECGYHNFHVTRPYAKDEVLRAPLLEQIFSEHVSFVWRTLRGMGVGEADREDMAQEVFLVVRRQLPAYEERGAMRSWLVAIARRVVADHRDRAHVRRELPRDTPPEGSTDPTSRLEARSSLERVEAALRQLDHDQRQVFLLYEVEGLTMPEIAEALGVPLQTCYSRLHSARDHVRSLFGGGSDQ